VSIDSLLLILCIFLLVLEAFFSGSEMAVIASDKLSLSRMADKGDSRAQWITSVISTPSRLLGTTLVGTNLCVVTNATIITYLVAKRIGGNSELIATAILSPLVLLFGELIPKSIAQRRPNFFSLKVSGFLRYSYIILRPFSFSLLSIARIFIPQQGDHDQGLIFTREDITSLIKEESKAPEIEKEEKEIIQRVFALRSVMVRETIKPINQVVALEETATGKEAVEVFERSGYTRIPLYSGHIYNITGVITIYDLLKIDDPQIPVKKLKKPALFVPEFKKVGELLQEMRQKKIPLAVVVDEYGAAIGIATIEDILEELVGEIEDEMDFIRHKGFRKPERVKNGYLFDARVELDHLSDNWGIDLPRKDIYQTLGGFILYHLGRIPKEGEELKVEGYTFKILKADEKSIKEVLISLPNSTL